MEENIMKMGYAKEDAVRRFASRIGFEISGNLIRVPDVFYGLDNKWHDPAWIDEAGNKYRGSYNGGSVSITTAGGAVIVG